VEGYESFWSCSTNAKSRGFNGVVTYAKTGTVQSADVCPLQDEELDSQGRCVMTNHGKFVLFNVYVPHGGNTSEGLVNKMKFLSALRKAMKKQRQEGRAVMLVGDMNAKIDKRDIFWRHRVVNVDEILEGLQTMKKEDVPKWKTDLEQHWVVISSVLQTIEVSNLSLVMSSVCIKSEKFS
jgi:exonuclease III